MSATNARLFTPARKAQGFRDQAHLDRFFAAVDHSNACPDCNNPGRATWLDGSASWQPTLSRCPKGLELDAAVNRVRG